MVDIKIHRAYTIQVQQRELIQVPGTAEPKHVYSTLFTTRADVKTKGGQSEFARVDINGKTVTHTFGIRYTTIPFDTRHRLRDARGQLYQILKVEDVDMANRELRIYCASQGNENVEAAR
jgi:Phage head-tail joining protein